MHTIYTRLSLADREEISRGIYAYETFAVIARRLNRPTSTIAREVGHLVKYRWCYRAEAAHAIAQGRRRKGRSCKIDAHAPLKQYVHEKLRQEWSPEEIAMRIKKEYREDIIMRISHETIYRYLYCLPRGALKKELMRGLRQERKLRQPRGIARHRREHIADILSITERPKEVGDRSVPGHWEGDLIVGKGHASAMGTLVERTTRLTLLVPLEKKDAFTVRKSFAAAFLRIPEKFKKSLTYDRGTEMSQHALFTKETEIKVYFADPHSPWQRGTNENTNGLIRQYFPKGTDFNMVPLSAIKEAERRLNSRPRKALDYYTPSEKFHQLVTGQEIALEG
jgi:transposase, IS30 family